MYSFDLGCLSKSTSAAANEGKWYLDGYSCTDESPIPSWITVLFDTEDDCCMKHVGPKHYDACMTKNAPAMITQPPTPKPTPKPLSTWTESSPTNEMNAYAQPSPNEMNAYVIQDTVTAPEVSPNPTRLPTFKPVKAQTASVNEYANTAFLFYPHYGEDSSVGCRNDGAPPEWITPTMMTLSRYECCERYFFPTWAEDCNDDLPFYPNFEVGTCVNDGESPDWMGGEYFADDMWVCCHNFYRDEEILHQCSGEL